MENPTTSLMHLTQIEEQAQEILTDRQEIIALDKQRNQNREAIRAIQKQDETSAWVTVGPLLVKMPIKKVSNVLNKGKDSVCSYVIIEFLCLINAYILKYFSLEQVHLDVEVNKLRSDLKVKVNKLRDLEHINPVPGLMLNPMSRDEMNAVGQILGRQST